MQVSVTGRSFDVTDALKGYVEQKADRLERHFGHGSEHLHVVLDLIGKHEHFVEANVHINGKDIHAEASHEDMYAAIDAMTDKMDRQMRKTKEKMVGKKRRPAPALEMDE